MTCMQYQAEILNNYQQTEKIAWNTLIVAENASYYSKIEKYSRFRVWEIRIKKYKIKVRKERRIKKNVEIRQILMILTSNKEMIKLH